MCRARGEEEICRSRASAVEARTSDAAGDADTPLHVPVGAVGGRRRERVVAAGGTRRRVRSGASGTRVTFAKRVSFAFHCGGGCCWFVSLCLIWFGLTATADDSVSRVYKRVMFCYVFTRLIPSTPLTFALDRG